MAPSHSEKLLSAGTYDRDAHMVDSDAGLDSESDSDLSATDELVIRSKVSDEDILLEEEEREKLLSKPSRFDTIRQAFSGKNDEGAPTRESRREARIKRRRERRRQRKRGDLNDGEVVFEMEGGFKDLSSQPSTESFQMERSKWTGKERESKKSFCRRIALIHVAIFLLFVGLAIGAYKASAKYRQHSFAPATLSNGTHNFAPTTIFFSLDGFRADFLTRGITPALNAIIASGVSPLYMLPSFPSVTFPNHFTLVTGLYPESHGVVGNQFWDPALQEQFYYTDASRSMQPKWWNAEPLWVTAEDQGVRTAIHMWPGSEAHIPDLEPTYLDKFNGSELLSKKVDRILGWLDLPGDQDVDDSTHERRPQLIAAYVPNVDSDGHRYGPNSTEILSTISDVDSMLALLVEGLYERNLTEIINIVIVSDHGMATTSTSRLVQLDNLIDLSLVDHIDGWPLRGLRLKNPERDVPILHAQLLREAEKSGSFDVYTLETMPERYHFTNNDRIAPLWIVPKTGWAVVERKNFDVAEAQTVGKAFSPKGLHGYDHEHPLMSAIFAARGPAFPHTPNSRVPVFQNIEVYNIVCDSLGIKPHPNNGTLRLPLKTEGLHDDKDAPIFETPVDFAPEETVDTRPVTDEPSSYDDLYDPDQDLDYPTEDETPGHDTEPEDDHASKSSWWDFVHGQIQKAKDWAAELVKSMKGNKPGDGDAETKPS